jgi:hypothetical protein
MSRTPFGFGSDAKTRAGGSTTMIKFARKLMVVAVLGWVGYVAAQAGWTYYATRDAVDRALLEAAATYQAPLRSGTFTEEMLAKVRNRVVQSAGQGLPVQAADVAVSATVAGFSATVHYDLPLITHRGKDILAVPVSLHRSLGDGLGS